MRSLLFALLILGASHEAKAQCPPGAKSCPAPVAPKRPVFKFRSQAGISPPWASVVRIWADNKGGKQVGTGTIIDGSSDSALVMTCAHVLQDTTSPVLVVEIFGGTINPKTGSVGRPIARYEASALDRDDVLDVGLVKFAPGRDLPFSRLVPDGWEPTASEPLCSIGCSLGANPSATTERYVGPFGSDGNYRGIVCSRKPEQGRSGGGLFEENGRLVGVCDFAIKGETKGVYASIDSLRSILARNGLTELAQGVEKRPPIPPAPAPMPATPKQAAEPPTPAPSPQPATEPKPNATPDQLPPIAKAVEGEVVQALWPIFAGAGIGISGFVAAICGFFVRIRSKKPAPEPIVISSKIPTPEDVLRLFLASLKDQEATEKQKAEEDARQKSDALILDQIKQLLAGVPLPKS